MNKKKFEEKKYFINDVAKKVGLSQKRIREYEKEGLVKPCRDPRTNNRIYVDTDIERIKRVKQLIHKHGFTLSCLKYFLASAPCWIVYNCCEKADCPAFKHPNTPCFEIMQDADSTRDNTCKTCSVYLNRDGETFSLFEKPE